MPGLTCRLSHPGEASNNSQMEPCIRLLESGGAGETGATMLVLLLLIVGVLLLDVGALVLIVSALLFAVDSSPPLLLAGGSPTAGAPTPLLCHAVHEEREHMGLQAPGGRPFYGCLCALAPPSLAACATG
jgi:hypothetical protein